MYGSLVMSQDADQLLYNLRRLKATYTKVITDKLKPGDPIPTGDEETDSGGDPVGTEYQSPDGIPEGQFIEDSETHKKYQMKGGKLVPVL
jgi:hypothetical protein